MVVMGENYHVIIKWSDSMKTLPLVVFITVPFTTTKRPLTYSLDYLMSLLLWGFYHCTMICRVTHILLLTYCMDYQMALCYCGSLI